MLWASQAHSLGADTFHFVFLERRESLNWSAMFYRFSACNYVCFSLIVYATVLVVLFWYKCLKRDWSFGIKASLVSPCVSWYYGKVIVNTFKSNHESRTFSLSTLFQTGRFPWRVQPTIKGFLFRKGYSQSENTYHIRKSRLVYFNKCTNNFEIAQ